MGVEAKTVRGQSPASSPKKLSPRKFSHKQIRPMLFRIFVMGGHPYNRVMGEDPVANLRSGKTPLGVKSGHVFPVGPWYNIWSHLPYDVKALFILTFRDGHQDATKRPSLDEWIKALQIYNREIDKGWHNNEILPASPKSATYKGTQPNNEGGSSQ
jgi:hypothetical protein